MFKRVLRKKKTLQGQSHRDFTKPNFGVYYDANGQVMATYDITLSTSDNKATLDEQHIYGASRLGMIKPNKLLYDNGVVNYPALDVNQNTLGQTYYEITNYLGNVNAVITDRKIVPIIPGTSLYEAVVVSTADFYPFGMEILDRSTNSGSYRFGYNSMEIDKEVSGNGNSYTTEFRQYDPRLGRWKSLDPLMANFPWQSPYVAFDNNPVYFVDPLGLAAEGWIKQAKLDENGNQVKNKNGDEVSTWVYEKDIKSLEQAQATEKYKNAIEYSDGKVIQQRGEHGVGTNELLADGTTRGFRYDSDVDLLKTIPVSTIGGTSEFTVSKQQELLDSPITNPGAGVIPMNEQGFRNNWGRSEDWENLEGTIHSTVMLMLSIAGGEALMAMSHVSNTTKAVTLVDDAANGGTKLLNQFNSAESLILGAGNLNRVKAGLQGFVKGDGAAIFKAISQGGTKQANGTVLMKDGTILLNHFSTKTGAYTIDINMTGQIYKIRVTP